MEKSERVQFGFVPWQKRLYEKLPIKVGLILWYLQWTGSSEAGTETLGTVAPEASLLSIAFNKGPIRMLYHIHLKREKGGEEGNLGSDLDVSAFYKFFSV